jgi:pyroglutamyl-peptidase
MGPDCQYGSVRHALVAGFVPLNNPSKVDETNASEQLVMAISAAGIEGWSLHPLLLPGAFQASGRKLANELAHGEFDVAICLGQAWGRAEVTVERVALNLADSWGLDNDLEQPIDEPIEPSGPAAYWTGLPAKELVTAMKAVGTPAAVSLTAGTHLCNYVFYTLMHLVAHGKGPRLSGFIHVPWLPEQLAKLPNTGVPTMALDVQVRGMAAGLRCLLERLG